MTIQEKKDQFVGLWKIRIISVKYFSNNVSNIPVNSCPPGYTGNALRSCQRGECLANEECPDNRACINYACVDPCIGKCGHNAQCAAKRHLAVCTCPDGFNGDAKVSCRQSRAFPVARYSRSLLKQLNGTIADIDDDVVPKEIEQA